MAILFVVSPYVDDVAMVADADWLPVFARLANSGHQFVEIVSYFQEPTLLMTFVNCFTANLFKKHEISRHVTIVSATEHSIHSCKTHIKSGENEHFEYLLTKQNVYELHIRARIIIT